MTHLYINVEDLEVGLRSDPDRCPIVRAVKRHLGKGYFVSAWPKALFLSNIVHTTLAKVPMPRGLQDFMIAHDLHGTAAAGQYPFPELFETIEKLHLGPE